uniref:Protein kinase domain-containing protein n=1 Tax=Panagrellus redivivus TaxID=6233 RepID=A0A7E4WCU5_PANRE
MYLPRQLPRAVAAILILAILPWQSVEARFNLLITRAEMNRTLGIAADMNYVQNGVINTYSTQFPYRVESNVSHIIFTWSSAIPNTAYTMRAVADTFDVLPVVHLPSSGVIPREPETFAVEYRCAGSRSGQFLITLHFNVSWPSASKPTVFTLKQDKICASRDGRRILEGFENGDSTSSKMSDLSFDQIVYIAVGGLLIVILFMVIVLCGFLRSRKQRKMKARKSTSRDAMIEDCESNRRSTPLTKEVSLFDSPCSEPFLKHPLTSTPRSAVAPTKLPKFATIPSASKAPQIIFEQQRAAVDINVALIELSADRNLFQVMPNAELEGTFGQVKWAIWRQTRLGICADIDEDEDQACDDIAVVCKTLKPAADKNHFQKFLSDALAFHNVPPHPHLAQVIGAATFGNFTNPETVSDFPLMCYRHQGFGNLKKFLIECRGSGDGCGTMNSRKSQSPTQALRTHELLSMAIQLTKAVNHLHKYGIIHKDVATRNCLVSEIAPMGSNDRMYVQLCDSALSKDLFPADYHCLGDNDNRPLKWMAPEAVRSKVHSSATDIWSIGVTMWELFTSAQQPLYEIEPEEYYTEMFEHGIRLGQPYNCPDELYGAMYSCWDVDPLGRPTPSQLLKLLEDFSKTLRRYI